MKLLLVNPWSLKKFNVIVIPNISLGYLAASLQKAGHEVEILDCVRDRIDIKKFKNYITGKDYEFIGFSLFTTYVGAVKQYTEVVKQINKNIFTASLHLIGLCSLDVGRTEIAVEHLEQLLESSDANPEQCLAAQFDLGRAYVELDRIEDARMAFEAVYGTNASYQDVAQRLTQLAAPQSDPAEPSDAPAFESFEDFLTDVEDE